METFSSAACTDCVSVRQRDTPGPVSSLLIQGLHNDEEGGVNIDVTEDPTGGTTETSSPVQSTNTLIYFVGRDLGLASDTIAHIKERVDATDGLSNCTNNSDIVVQDKPSGTASNGGDQSLVDDNSDGELLDSDDDDDDDDCNLVVNMDFTEDLESEELLPASVGQLSVPKMAKPVSLSVKLSPSPPTTQTSTATTDSKHHLTLTSDISTRVPSTAQIISGSGAKKMTTVAASGPSPRLLPIHCVIEQASEDVDGCHDNHIVLDTYAILPGPTLFSELVTTSLLRLGYSPNETARAKGGIQLKNWQTLMFGAVTDNQEATVEEILGEITSVATLRIELSSQTGTHASCEDTKDRLLQLLLTKSTDVLMQAGCPVEKSLLEALSTGEFSQSISQQVCTAFNDWYMRQKMTSSTPNNCPSSVCISSTSSPSELSLQSVTSVSHLTSDVPMSSTLVSQPQTSDMKVQLVTAPLSRLSPLNLDIKKEQPMITLEDSVKTCAHSQEVINLNHLIHGHKESDSPHRNKKLIDKTPDKNCLQSELFKFSRSPSEASLPSTLQTHPSNPYLGLMPGKTRIRTSFDPEQEIPRLQKWFSSNQHPTREQMMRFMHELNGLESRKGRRPLDLTNIIYWFKNARAAQRRATRALDDSFENEENVDMNSAESGNSTTDSVPPFLPNKNAVYMIPFHPYPHLVSSAGAGASDRESLTSAADTDEPYDLSLTKRPSSELSKIRIGKEREDSNYLSMSTSPSPTKSSSTSSECESQGSLMKRKKPYCPPRFPALLDVASKMRQEIPLRPDDIYTNNGNHISSHTGNHISSHTSNHISSHNGCRRSPFRSGSGTSVMEHSSKIEDLDSNLSNPPTPVENGDSGVDKFSMGLKVKQEDDKYLSCQNSRKNYHHSSHVSRDTGLELGQIQKENDNKVDTSEDDDDDDDNTNDSYISEEELKLRIKQNAAAAAVVDYASAMHNNVSRLTAANMAALSLAQMGQPLHIPQLTSSLAMAYYPMDPRFYSQAPVPHSLTTSPPSSMTTTHPSHLSLRQSHDCAAHIESRSPLPSPSIMQQSLTQLNHHHHHHQHHQQQSPQQHHHRHNSEPRKRRTRVFIDPLTEIPKLEKWFTEDTHPSAFMIDKYCEELNKCEYRHKFPKLEPKNIQLWFKNHRAKVKRLKVSFDEQADQNGTGGHDDDIDD